MNNYEPPKINLKVNDTFNVIIPFSSPKASKIHICHIVKSCYSDETLIIYKVFGKHKRWWHEFMCTKQELEFYIDFNNLK